ncbi:TPA: 23S rRNA (adenine(2030)-N(6))-methyltransferase RlmJ [Legionella pneumophila]|nr:23S rRNA (adenine(2030)-N(6))-methyltransferase RlmJ [Legionella pneumophila]HAU1319441.1 23S rRNA (adenine(2030)-N(6))-methyltransferase RlmJ [Legionella pneumophila]HBC0466605.1 23S rRNA (adenine(2030)-N(6))-methyltransferase RlmJ [Legionella pneumophila]HBD9374853.1 23S rRNA (adenine(2030)-N(6))-methyltransferase RlmJ [Legionella pneumophila]HBI2945061.1 23S rRNA (adenine(2030)-N(6))-methyltransferase RlmJ [Legionella pneumophila]
MLSYQHGYHAGNFADVIKHITLTRLLVYLTHKDKPLFYLETHSGRGIYDLKDKQSLKTEEYKEGINPVWINREHLPSLFLEYISVIKQINPSQTLRYYPGSPYFAISQLRSQDRLYLCELHPTEHNALLKLLHLNKKAHVSHTDGVSMLKALLPPPEKRGVIFVDPSYERKEEYKEIPTAIKNAYSKFSTGVYCVWYPVVKTTWTEQFLRKMKEISTNSVRIEFHLNPLIKEGMTGCGLWIINPPYTFPSEIKAVLETLKTYFNPGSSSYIIESGSKLCHEL